MRRTHSTWLKLGVSRLPRAFPDSAVGLVHPDDPAQGIHFLLAATARLIGDVGVNAGVVDLYRGTVWPRSFGYAAQRIIAADRGPYARGLTEPFKAVAVYGFDVRYALPYESNCTSKVKYPALPNEVCDRTPRPN